MTPGRIPAAPSPHDADRGFTLLEVLVSLGIIIGALAGIAALLPAAGSRLSEATNIDRAGTMSANAQAEIFTRGLASSEFWQNGRNATVFGEGLPAISDPAVGTANVSSRIDPTTGFHLRDVVQTTVTGNTVIVGTGYEPGICYGCMVSSTATSRSRGDVARVTTVVFQKPSAAVQRIALTGTFGQALVLTGTLTTAGTVVPVDAATAASLRRQFLAGCAWVLVVTGSTGSEPRWTQVGSSWTAFAAGQTTGTPTGTSRVVLTGTDHSLMFSGSTTVNGVVVGSGTLQVIGFESLLRVDERFVNLE